MLHSVFNKRNDKVSGKDKADALTPKGIGELDAQEVCRDG